MAALLAAAILGRGGSPARAGENISGDIQQTTTHERISGIQRTEIGRRLDLRLTERFRRNIDLGIRYSGYQQISPTSSRTAASLTPYLEARHHGNRYDIYGGFEEARGGSIDQPAILRRTTRADLRLTPLRFSPVSFHWNKFRQIDQSNPALLNSENEQLSAQAEAEWQGIRAGYDWNRSSYRDLRAGAPPTLQISSRFRGDVGRRLRIVPALEANASAAYDASRSYQGGTLTAENDRIESLGRLAYNPSPWFGALWTADISRNRNRQTGLGSSSASFNTKADWTLRPGLTTSLDHTRSDDRWRERTGSSFRRTTWGLSAQPWQAVRASANALVEEGWDKATGLAGRDVREYGFNLFARAYPDLDLDANVGSRTDHLLPARDRAAVFGASYRGIRRTDMRLTYSFDRSLADRGRNANLRATTYLLEGNFRVTGQASHRASALARDRFDGSFGISWSHQGRLTMDATLNVVRQGDVHEAHLPLAIGLDFRPTRYLIGRVRYVGSDLLHTGADLIQLEIASSGAPGSSTLFLTYSLNIDHDGPDGQTLTTTFRRWF